MKYSASKIWDRLVYSLLILILVGFFAPYFFSDFFPSIHTMQVYWKKNEESYSETNSSVLCSAKGTSHHKLTFEDIESANFLRLDPITHGSIVDKIDIHNIKVFEESRNSSAWKTVNFNSITSCNNCNTTTKSGVLSVDVTGEDPWFELPLPSQKSYKKVEIEFNVSSSRPPVSDWLREFFKSNHLSVNWITCDNPPTTY